MEANITREQALALLREYNEEPFHIQHALTVEGVLRWYARELGCGADEEFWALAGLLHDIDFERWPEEHCRKAPELLEKAKKEIRQGDEDSARRHKIAGLFCKAFEKAVLLTPTEENVRIWAECTRMNQDEIRDSAQEARELAEVFTAIANILGTMLKDQGGNESIA